MDQIADAVNAVGAKLDNMDKKMDAQHDQVLQSFAKQQSQMDTHFKVQQV